MSIDSGDLVCELYSLVLISLEIFNALGDVYIFGFADFVGEMGEAFLSGDFEVDVLGEVDLEGGLLISLGGEGSGGVDGQLLDATLV